MSEVHVTGLADLQKFLDTLPAKLEANVMRGALRAGINDIKAAAFAACPVGPPSAQGKKRYKLYTGALRDSLRVSTKSRNGVVTASLKAGGKLKNGADVWYAHFIEFSGAVPHLIKARKASITASNSPGGTEGSDCPSRGSLKVVFCFRVWS